jgi:hypothetical protein
MPSKLRQLHYLGLHVMGWLLWLPFTGNLRHGRTWGEFKRLHPRQAAVMLVPLACYVGVGTWLFLYFPKELYLWAGSVYATGLVAAGSLITFTVALRKFLDWRLTRA